MNKKQLQIILYGEKNLGKTTTLIKLVKLLVNNPTVSNQIDSLLKTGNKYKDARFVIELNVGYIFVATGGDSWAISRGNCEFFNGSYSNMVGVYLITGSTMKLLNNDEKKDFKERKKPIVSVCACRPSGDKYGAIKAIHSNSEQDILNYSYQIWIQKQINSVNDSNATALQIKNCIDKFLSSNCLF